MFTVQKHFPTYVYPDPKHKLAVGHRKLTDRFPDSNIAITSSTTDMTIAVARVSAPKEPAVFHVVDVATVFNADRIRAAVLLAHGARDRYVPVARAQRMHDALTKAGTPVELVIEPHEGHVFLTAEVIAAHYERLLRFFHTHLSPRARTDGIATQQRP